MQYIRPKISTVCIGQAASMGSFLLAAGEPGMRVALTNSRIMVHQPSGGAQGMAADIEIQAREILRMRQRLNELYAKYTGQKIEDIEKAMDRDKFLEADEAKAFGIIDEVFDTRPKPATTPAPARAMSRRPKSAATNDLTHVTKRNAGHAGAISSVCRHSASPSSIRRSPPAMITICRRSTPRG